MPKIFISYRRADSQTFTDHIYDRLTAAFGESNVFQDVDSIPLGADFRIVLRKAVESCDIVLVMIGSQWASVTDEQGRQRLMNPADFVRIEVESALNSQKIVIPVVIEGATMPVAEDLPSSLHELLFRNAAKIRHNPDFNRDMQRLIEQIKLHDTELAQQRADEEAERQRQAELEAQAKAEADERERQRQAELEAQAKAEADERERQRRAAEQAERQRQADIEAQIKAQEADRERRRLAEEQIQYEDKARQRRAELAAAERERQSQLPVTAKPSKSASSEPYKVQTLPESRKETYVSSQPDWQRFFTGRSVIVLLALIVVAKLVAPIIQKSRTPGITHNAEWTPIEQNVDGVTMVQVPAGCFDMGNDPEAYDGSSRGVGAGGHICFEKAFWLDKTEVTNAQFAQFGGKADQPSNWTDANRPRETITWIEASNFCVLRGVRLPTEAEWEYAARGPDNLVYPWGNEFEAANVVYAENSGNQTAAIGSRLSGKSWVGALDLSGNVWEWVSTLYMPYPYPIPASSEESEQWINSKDGSDSRTLRGGSWYNTDTTQLRVSLRSRSYPYFASNPFGFRCAMSTTS